MPIQYLTYMAQMLTGDWGTSIGTKRPVLAEILNRLPATLESSSRPCSSPSRWASAWRIPSARWRGHLPDVGVRVVALIGVSLPAFFLGLILQVVFFRNLGWLPLTGRTDSDLRFVAPITSITGVYLVDSLLTLESARRHRRGLSPDADPALYPIGLIDA